MVILLNLGNLIITELEGSPVSLNEKYCIQKRRYRRQILGMSVLKCAFLCRVVFPCSLSPLQTFYALLKDRIVSCSRQSCWHLLSFLFVRCIFWFLFLCQTSVHSEIFHNLYLP